MHDSNRLFVELQPPAGGLQRLQKTLAIPRPDRPQHSLRLATGAALATSVLILTWLLPGIIVRQQQTAALTSALRAEIAPAARGIRVVNGAALELPSNDPDVRLYLVQSATTPSAGNH